VSLSLVIAIGFALAFSLTNGFHDASNAIATLVGTRGASPGQAISLSATFNLLGAVFLGTAVADTIGGLVDIPGDQAVVVIGAALAGATAWNLITWRFGLPSSSGHALVGGLVGAALAAGGASAVNWGGMNGLRPEGVIGVLVALFVSPPLGFAVGGLLLLLFRTVARRFTRRWARPVVGGEWVAAAALSYSHGANDAQKSMGVIGALLLAAGVTSTFTIPLWVKVLCGITLTLGTALGGWRIVRTVGRRIYGLHPLDSLASQTASTSVIYGASLLGAPVSTTQVVASSVVGIGGARHRWRHVRWAIVREMLAAWVITMPAAAVLAIVVLYVWEAVTP
jgi:PiT family inorganic phosphate transporter